MKISTYLSMVTLSILLAGCGSSSTIEEFSSSSSTINGKVIDGEITGAKVFYDINRNGLFDTNEPYAISDKKGSFQFEISNNLAQNYTIPVVSIGGVDIRTKKKFTQNLMAFREDGNNTVILTPLSTLIACNVLNNKDSDDNKKVFEYLKSAKNKYAKTFNINSDILLQNPIELGISGNTELMRINMEITKTIEELSKATKDTSKQVDNNSIKVISALSETLVDIDTQSTTSSQVLLSAIESLSQNTTDVFDENKLKVIKESTAYILDNFNNDWNRYQNDIKNEIKTNREFLELTKDKISPKIILNGNTTINIIQGTIYQELGAIAIDNKDGLIDVDINNSIINTNNIGQYKVIYSAKDSSNNQAIVSRIVNVIKAPDTTAPVITLKGAANVDIILGNNYKELGAKAFDDEDGDVNVTIIDNDLDINKLGTYHIIYNAKDTQGNESNITRTINIVDPIKIIENLNNISKKCSSWNSIEIPNQDSFYTLNNNDWGRQYLNKDRDGIQCIFSFQENNITKGGWYWGWPSNGDYQVKGYPEAIYGAKFKHILNKNSGFPILVNDIDNITTEVKYRDLNLTKNYNIALEFWLHTDKKTSMDNIEYEIMFRFDPNGFHPHKTKLGEKNLDGIEFDVYKNADYDGSTKRIFINFVAKEKVKNFKIDFKEALDYLTDIEFEDIPQRYMSGIEMGVEIIDGSGALILDKFEVALNKTIVEELTIGQNFEKLYNSDGNYTIINAPKGMRILKNGLLTWTPTPNQIGNRDIKILKDDNEIDELVFKVDNEANVSADGYFIDFNLPRDKSASGNEDEPFTNMIDACKVLQAGDTLYIRGGIYKPSDYLDGNISKGVFIRVTGCYGEKNNNIVIKPWGNELVKILSDGYNAISVNNSSYVTIKDLEIEGVAQKITLEEALKDWWNGSKYYNSGGIAINKSKDGITHNIIIDGCIVHDVCAAGIKGYNATHIKIINNIVYNTNWWTVQGTTAVGVVLAPNLDDEDTNTYYNQITNNLLFGTQQRVFSRDWPKSHVNFVLDEGEALLVQEGNREVGDENGDNRTGYDGRYLIKNNIVVYNGKGMVVNLADKVDLINNTVYRNGYIQSATFRDLTSGGLNINASNDINLTNNIFNLDDDSITIWYNSEASNIKKMNNHFKGYFLSANNIDYSGITKHDDTIVDEQFKSMIENVGANLDILKKAKKFGITEQRLHYDINKTKTAQLILDSMPDDIKVVDINDSDSKYLRIYLQLPQEHPHTIITGSSDYVMEIPQTYASELTLPTIDK